MKQLKPRIIKQIARLLARAQDPRRQLLAILNAGDQARFRRFVLEQPNGSSQLQLWYQAIADTADSLEAISNAIADGDGEEAQRLIALAHQSLTDHQTELKGLL